MRSYNTSAEPRETNISSISAVSPSKESSIVREISIGGAPEKPTVEEFPLGVYDRIDRAKHPEQIQKYGFNLVMPYVGYGKDYSTIEKYLDAASAAGIQVMLEPFRDAVRTGDIATVTEFVRTFKQHPAVFGWYAYDEPNIKKREVSPQTLESVYKAIKIEDPERPVAVTFSGGVDARYLNALDIAMSDMYPSKYGQPEFNNLDKFRELIEVSASRAKDKEFWPVIQAYGRHKLDIIPNAQLRFPTIAEERYMIYTALLAGADGLFFYAYHRASQSWVDSVLTPVVEELHGYIPAIKTGLRNGQVKVNRPDIQVALYQDPKTEGYLLVAVYHGSGKVDATIEINGLVSANSVRVLEEERTVDLKGKSLKDVFDSYAVHIYAIH
jgi:hypothetical protein